MFDGSWHLLSYLSIFSFSPHVTGTPCRIVSGVTAQVRTSIQVLVLSTELDISTSVRRPLKESFCLLSIMFSGIAQVALADRLLGLPFLYHTQQLYGCSKKTARAKAKEKLYSILHYSAIHSSHASAQRVLLPIACRTRSETRPSSERTQHR